METQCKKCGAVIKGEFQYCKKCRLNEAFRYIIIVMVCILMAGVVGTALICTILRYS